MSLHLTFIADNNTNQLLACYSKDGSNWSPSVAVEGQASKAAPALAVFQNKLWVAFVANNRSIPSSPTRTISWRRPTSIWRNVRKPSRR